MDYEWNVKKNRENYQKHGIWFEEAVTIWADVLSVEFFDPDHSIMEERYIRIGHTSKNRLVLVVFCERSNAIRIISARKVTSREKQIYEEGI